MRLLIVDDSELVLDRVIKLLSDIKNLQIVGTAQNSVLGEQLAGELNPDVVISDIRMPGGGGFDLLEKVKAKYPNVIVCIYTNYPHEQFRDKAMSLGADYFFQKTTESEELYKTLSDIASNGDKQMRTNIKP